MPGKGDRFGSFETASVGSPLHAILRWFKTMSTNEYIKGVKQSGWPPFNGKLWQRNYYEHIIRNENELLQIREYVANNPANWEIDSGKQQ
ncbi:MAG TPA: transposase [Candidatus Kapabacteria bacterium]|nr:transposase [Candidatus Kapabacteria bacterium]